MEEEPKFKISYGRKGSKQVIFFGMSKANHLDILEMIEQEFPHIPAAEIRYIPGPGFTMITNGSDFEL